MYFLCSFTNANAFETTSNENAQLNKLNVKSNALMLSVAKINNKETYIIITLFSHLKLCRLYYHDQDKEGLQLPKNL